MNNTDGRVLGMNNTKKERIMRAGKASKDFTKKKGKSGTIVQNGTHTCTTEIEKF